MAAYAQTVKNYTINTTAKTITFTDYATIVLERIALITDITTGTIIYQFNSTAVTGTVATNVLTLSSMTGVTNTDKLRIDYTNATGDPTYETPALPNGAATSAKQPALGTAVTSASTPVNIASDQIVPVRGSFVEQASLTSAATATPLVASTDVSAYKWLSLQITGTFVATIQFQGSNDGTNFQPIPLISTTSTAAVATTQTGGTGIFTGPVDFRYFKVVLTAYTSGTVNGTLELYHSASAMVSIGGQVAQSGTWTVGSNSATGSAYPANAFPAGIRTNGGNLSGLYSAAAAGGDGTSLDTSIASGEYRYNNATWDRVYSNVTGVIKAAGQTATTTTSQVTYNAEKLLVALNVASGSGTVQVTINGVTSSGYSYPLLVGTTQTGTGLSVFRVGSGLTSSSGLVANDLLPRTISVVATVTGTVAYGLDYVLGN